MSAKQMWAHIHRTTDTTDMPAACIELPLPGSSPDAQQKMVALIETATNQLGLYKSHAVVFLTGMTHKSHPDTPLPEEPKSV